MNKYTVIGTFSDNKQIFADFVEANSRSHAFYVCAEKESFRDADFICALDGHQNEGGMIDYAGSASVDGDTIVSQPDVYC